MAQAVLKEYNTAEHHRPPTGNFRRPNNVIVVYDQPKVVIVRRYTRAIITNVNPEEYRKIFDSVLLDTGALIKLTRRLNIHENVIELPPVQQT